MGEILSGYWPVILIAAVIGLIVGLLVFRPRQRVKLTESAPLRPHMMQSGAETTLGHEASVTTQHVLGTGKSGQAESSADDLEQLKGVGPKLAAMLVTHGLSRFDQIAKLTDSEIDRIDADLGAFRGRLRRDRVVEQAAYLARGDVDGFEQQFGKL